MPLGSALKIAYCCSALLPIIYIAFKAHELDTNRRHTYAVARLLDSHVVRMPSRIARQILGSVPDVPNLISRPEVRDLNCRRILEGDVGYMSSVSRRVLVEDRNLDMSCSAIRSRVLAAPNPDENFPLAYARAVFEGYEHLEEQLSINYSAENWYCYTIDVKSTLSFWNKFLKLSSCIPNVVVNHFLYDIDSAGHNMNSAHYDCLKKLRHKQWKYVILMQNHDILIKTQQEVKKIIRTLGGANDVDIRIADPFVLERIQGVETNLGKLGLCPRNFGPLELAACRNAHLSWHKGAVQGSLSRETVDYIVDNMNISVLVDGLQRNAYGIDEFLTQTLLTTDALKIPGRFPARCMNTTKLAFISRKVDWQNSEGSECTSNIWRHKVCIYGVEDVARLSGAREIMANKMMPQSDYGAIACIKELLYNRTHRSLNDYPLNMTAYETLPMSILSRERKRNPNYLETMPCECLTGQ